MKNITVFILMLLPFTVFASGGEVIFTFLLDVIVVFSLLIGIALLKWKISGKIVLLITLASSECFTFIGLGGLPYHKNATVINILSVIIPLMSVFGIYLFFRKKFAK